MRLNKYISETGHCSRREADALIAEGRVTVGGRPADLGTRLAGDEEIRVDGEVLRPPHGDRREHHVYIALNKPVGVTCTTEHSVEGNIVDFLYRARSFQRA